MEIGSDRASERAGGWTRLDANECKCTRHRLARFVYPRVSNALRNCRVARVHVKEIARFLNRSLPEKISQAVASLLIMSESTMRLVKRDVSLKYEPYKVRVQTHRQRCSSSQFEFVIIKVQRESRNYLFFSL